MRLHRFLLTVPMLAMAYLSPAQSKVALGKLGQATEATAVYTAPSTNSKMYYRLEAYDYLVVRHTSSPNWDKVLLKSGRCGYTPTYVVAELPYTVYRQVKPRATSLAARGRYDMALNALNYRGTPYEWGGNDLNSGVDCSGFVKQLAGKIGMDLPRTAAEQSEVGEPISRLEDLRAGDRLYFKERSETRISHTGIYLGRGYFIHASHGKGGVATDILTPGWCRMLVAARR